MPGKLIKPFCRDTLWRYFGKKPKSEDNIEVLSKNIHGNRFREGVVRGAQARVMMPRRVGPEFDLHSDEN